jgi:hypothetical protein
MKVSFLFFAVFLFAGISANATLTESEGCFQIGSSDDLYEFAAIYNSSDKDTMAMRLECVKLTQDIVVNKNVLTDSGSLNEGSFKKWEPINDFYGTFDGDGHAIYGLYVNDAEKKNVGFFGKVGAFEIKNLGLEDFYFRGEDNVGAFVGYTIAPGKVSLISNSYSSGVVVGVSSMLGCVGGFVGFAQSTIKFSSCWNESVLYGGSKIGGFVGLLNTLPLEDDRPSICQSYNAGQIYGSYQVGGLVGMLAGYSGLEIKNAYNKGYVEGDYEVGGIVGVKKESMGILAVYNTYNVGKISPSKWAIVGDASDSGLRLDNCFYLKQDSLAAANVSSRSEPITTGFTASEEKALYDGSVAAALRGWKETDSTGAVIDGENGLVWAEDPAEACVLPHFVWEKDDPVSSSVCLVPTPVAPKKWYGFGVSVVNGNLQVAHARVGDRYVLFDMQGNVVFRGTVNSSNFNMVVPVSGNYVLRIGNGTRKVTVGN